MSRALRCAAILGGVPVADIDTNVLDGLAAKLEADGLEAASINRHLSALSKLMRWAHARGLSGRMVRSPWRKEPKGRSRVLKPEELKAVTAWFEENTCRSYTAFVTFLAETGTRCGEARALRWEDVSQDKRLRYWATLKDTKNGEDRSVPLSKAAYAALKLAGGGDPIFGQVVRSTFSRLWATCRKELGLHREIVPHSLRHSRASILVNAGVPIAHIQAWLGHRDIKTTMRYAHTERSSLERALKQMEDK